VIAVESPTYFSVLQLIEQLGMLALEVPTDPSEGMHLDSLEERLRERRVKAVISVANFANPTGALMPDANKRRLVEMLSERQIPLIEDDINGELFFSAVRPANAKRFDTDGWVLTCASFSKTLAPGYRVGWVLPGRFKDAVIGYRVGWVLPGRFKDAVIKAKQVSTSATASLPQLAIAEFLRTGSYDRHLRRLRSAYREQVECVRNTVGELFPGGTRITRPQGGMVLWVELPRGVDSVELFNKALAAGVSITPGPLFSPTRKFKNYLRITCGRPWDEDIAHALQTLADLVEQMLD
jgi:DNA-binding transcriptional MocR family regulator